MLNLPRIRANFPALSLLDAGQARVYLDNPGGTQVAQQVVDRMTHYLVHNNANHDGAFRTSRESDVIQAAAHSAMADLLNAAAPAEIIFGQNMTSLTFAMSRSLAQGWQAGDELVVTRLDHDGNIAPWLAVAADRGMTVKWLDVDVEDCTLQTEQLQQLLTPRTRLVAVGYASNAVGTVNPIAQIAAQVHAAGALLFVDAVQWVAHGPTDVQALGADLLACSAYKFFGPHQGVLWGRQALLEQLPAYKVRPASAKPPGKFETGTQSHEGLAGVLGAVDYFEWLGAQEGGAHAAQFKQLHGRRHTLCCGLAAIQAYERTLSHQLIEGLQRIRGVHVYGITDAQQFAERVATVSFTLAGYTPRQVAEALGAQNIFVWDGNYYAVEVVERLGLSQSGGMVRVGAVHYNTPQEIERVLQAVEDLAAARKP
ncbi:cysteine desulfurase-like protein [Anaerolineae bacterium]|nr:probable cysteine desulfurase [Anaerolineaceae bacterium]GBL38375.1 probable cysteine desulfurase [Anaerolineaceae bacterium]GDX68125.1 cysteine desulfurase-like protein [Anaerolineae bacterium]